MAELSLTIGTLTASITAPDDKAIAVLQAFVQGNMPQELYDATTNQQKLEWTLRELASYLQVEAKRAHVRQAAQAAQQTANEEAQTNLDLGVQQSNQPGGN